MRAAYLSPIWLVMTTIFPAAGGSFVYSSLAGWQASSPGLTPTLDFESTPIGYNASFATNPFTITAGTGGEWLLGSAAAGTGSGHYLTTDVSSVMNIALASGVYGVGFNLGANTIPPATATIVATDVNGVQYTTTGFTTSGAVGPADFWGLRTSVQLVSVKITFTSVFPQLDNVQYSNTPLPPPGPSTPEPSSGVLVLSGGVMTGACLWRRYRRRAP